MERKERNTRITFYKRAKNSRYVVSVSRFLSFDLLDRERGECLCCLDVIAGAAVAAAVAVFICSFSS